MGDDDFEFKSQEQFGRAYKNGEFFLYQIQVLFPEHVVNSVTIHCVHFFLFDEF
jgi:hypothetical protein